ncbi:hypothetical protein ABZ760_25775 [Streptomyces sp. NPDC006658]|uniref:hypothetical protein n=1 Tax=unclassified Streptomyces TaxID=2593676 RepID=UPI0033DA1BEB
MADDEFYRRDRPDDAALSEDRPREGALPKPHRGGKAVWITVGVVAVLIIVFALILV